MWKPSSQKLASHLPMPFEGLSDALNLIPKFREPICQKIDYPKKELYKYGVVPIFIRVSLIVLIHH